MNKLNLQKILFAGLAATAFAACSDDDVKSLTDSGEVGKDNDVFSASEWYPGGELGTVGNEEGCYSNETQAVHDANLYAQFKFGEQFFERSYTESNRPFNGLGPAWVRDACIKCHPSYGHGWRQETVYNGNTYGNGYLLVMYHQNDKDGKPYTPNENGNSDAIDAKDSYCTEVVGMPQTLAQSPFLPPVEDNIPIEWKHVDSMPSGIPMKFKDGDSYDLIYPYIDPANIKFNVDPAPTNYQVRLESTIGVYGTALIDAISNEDLEAQYKEEGKYVKLNPAMFDNDKKEMASTAYYSRNGWDQGTNNIPRIKRFTYTLTRGSLQDGPGANAIWNITNVSRSDRRLFYSTKEWAKAMSENEEVVKKVMEMGKNENSPLHPFYDKTFEGTQKKILDGLSLVTPYNDAKYQEFHDMGFQDEMKDQDYYNFMVWHRGLGVPQARDLNKAQVKRGKQLFYEIGCTNCHKPSWKTGDDNYWADALVKGFGKLPTYPNQTIWPYSDFIQHRLDMKNNVRTGWCRTTPLWGRGLSLQNTGHQDRLHDCRARNEIEAIMWHGYSKNSDALEEVKKFYNLSKEDREAVVAFIRAI